MVHKQISSRTTKYEFLLDLSECIEFSIGLKFLGFTWNKIGWVSFVVSFKIKINRKLNEYWQLNTEFNSTLFCSTFIKCVYSTVLSQQKDIIESIIKLPQRSLVRRISYSSWKKNQSSQKDHKNVYSIHDNSPKIYLFPSYKIVFHLTINKMSKIQMWN